MPQSTKPKPDPETQMPGVDDTFAALWEEHQAKAARNKPFADLNHIDGVLAEEMREFQECVDWGDNVTAMKELLDVAAAALRAASQLHDEMIADPRRAWVQHDCCENPWCVRHDMHAFECPCSPVDRPPTVICGGRCDE